MTEKQIEEFIEKEILDYDEVIAFTPLSEGEKTYWKASLRRALEQARLDTITEIEEGKLILCDRCNKVKSSAGSIGQVCNDCI